MQCLPEIIYLKNTSPFTSQQFPSQGEEKWPDFYKISKGYISKKVDTAFKQHRGDISCLLGVRGQ